MAFKHYFYNEQLRKYLLQVGDLFSGIRVRTGRRSNGQSIFVTVPVKYASQDRMAQMFNATHGQGDPQIIDRTNVSIPIISFNLAGLELDPANRRYQGIIDRRTYVTIEDALDSTDTTDMSTKIRTKARSVPISYKLTVEVHLWASNTDQHLQILEQLMMVFNPELIIQVDDSAWDWTALTKVKLNDISLEEAIPVGTDDRIITSTLSFEMPVWISGPMKETKGGYVGAVRAVVRDASDYTGNLDDLTIGDNTGTLPAGTTSNGIVIDIIGTPEESIVDVTTDENGVSSGQTLPPKSDYNT